MSAIIYNFNRDSFCATCLSQNGILIAVRHSQVCMLFYSELNLRLTDRVCPVCHDFVQRMIAFKSRAQQAQAWLQNMTFQSQKLLCVTPLTRGLKVMAPNTMPATTDSLTLDVKSEPENHQEIKVELKQNETSIHLDQNVYGNFQQLAPHIPRSVNSDTVIKSEIEDNTHGNLHQNMASSYQLQPTHSRVPTAVPSDSAMLIKPETDDNDGNCNDNAETLPLKNIVPCRTLQQNHGEDLALGFSVTAMPLTNPENECNGNDNVEEYENLHQNVIPRCNQIGSNQGAPATSKPSHIIKPEAVENRSNIGVADDVHKRNTNSVEVSVFTHQKVKPNKASAGKNKSKTPATALPDYIYTEQILTEGEMTQWRQMKSHTEFYARGVPSERCERCIEPFDYRVIMRAHAQLHTEAYGELVCDICQQRTFDKPAMELHKKWHHRLLKCRYCPFVWDNVNTMRHHCRKMHNVPQVLWDCDRCERKFSSLRQWRQHVRNHRRTKCTVCGLTLNEQSLKIHMKTHTNGIPVKKCEECGKQYRSVEGLRCHMLRHRGEGETAYCVDCNMQFRNKMSYRTHLYSRKHLGQEKCRFECNDCGKKFPIISQLRVHMDVHSDTKYPCDKCDKVYNSRQNRARHIWSVHERREKREHICDLCGKVYMIKNLLIDHINTHTGARPYACKICGDAFGYKSALYLHGRFKHKIQKKNKGAKKIGDANKIGAEKKIGGAKKIGDKKIGGAKKIGDEKKIENAKKIENLKKIGDAKNFEESETA